MNSTSIDELAALIYSRKQAFDRAFQSDLVNFRVKYGEHLVSEALRLVERLESDGKLSIEGTRARRYEERIRVKAKEEAFQRR
jgi:hypothetical protein